MSSYIIYGSDLKAKQEFVANILEQNKLNENLNTTTLKDEVTLEDIITSIQTIPFVNDKRCVIVFDFLWEDLRKKNKLLLINLLKNIPERMILIFIRTADKLPATAQKMLKEFNNFAEIVKLNLSSESELAHSIKSMLQKENIEIEISHCNSLVNICKASPIAINNEISKLIAYAQAFNKRKITLSDIELMIKHEPEQNVFKLGNLIISGDLEHAIAVLYELIQTTEQPIIIGALRFLFSDMLNAKLAQVNHIPMENLQTDFSNTYKGKGFRIKNAYKIASKVSLKSICECIFILSDADLAFKTYSNDNDALQEVICKLYMCLHA